MSNTLTNVKDIKVAQKALMPFMANLLPVTAFSTNFGPQPADKLDTVRVPLVGAPSGSSDFAGDYTANADSTVTTVPVTLNRHKFKTVHVTARESGGNRHGRARHAGRQPPPNNSPRTCCSTS